MNRKTDPHYHLEALQKAFRQERCPRHHRGVFLQLEEDKLIIRYCCKEFGDLMAPIKDQVNKEVFIRSMKDSTPDP